MFRILIGAMKQETATFNPWPTRSEDFRVHRGPQIEPAYAGTETEIAGALEVFRDAHDQIEIIPTIAAAAISGGPVAHGDLERLLGEIVDDIRRHRDRVDAAFFALHGAMTGETEDDPEGRLLSEARRILGARPIVASLDLHAVLTQRMIDAADMLPAFHTYPHVDHHQTGVRAARNLLRLLRGEVRPTTARVKLPMLVRGDELITATGRFGEAMRMCQAIERSPGGLAAGVFIGNPFTDVPELQSNVLITTDNDLRLAEAEARRIAEFMWDNRQIFRAHLTPLDEAIRIAEQTKGLTVFSDGADATGSGASGDSNAILRGLIERNVHGRALVPIVDSPAVEMAFAAGVGATRPIPLGGTRDPGRFTPLTVNAYVKSLHDGRFINEDGTAGDAGRAAVLIVGSIHVLVTQRAAWIIGRRIFQAHGLEPRDFNVVVVKSPNGYRPWYEPIAARMIPVDVPGSTSANLHSLPYRRCPRPIFPLDPIESPFPAQAAS